MPEIDEIITALKVDDNDALESIRKLDSTSRSARQQLEETKGELIEIKDEVTDPMDVEVGVALTDEISDEDKEIPLKVTIEREKEDQPEDKGIEIDVSDLDIEKLVRSDIVDKIVLSKSKEIQDNQEISDVSIFVEGPDELINDSIVKLLAEERFDLDKLDDIGGGYSRSVYNFDDDKVLKVLNAFIFDVYDVDKDDLREHFAQNLTEGSVEGLPKVLERGLDYVVVEKAEYDFSKSQTVVQQMRDALFQTLMTSGGLGNEGEAAKRETFLEEAKKIDEKWGSKFVEIVKSDNDFTTHYSELMRADNIGFMEGVPVPIDPGGLAWRDTDTYVENNYPGGILSFDEDFVVPAMEHKEEIYDKEDEKDELAKKPDFNNDPADLISPDEFIEDIDTNNLMVNTLDEDPFAELSNMMTNPDEEIKDMANAVSASDEKPQDMDAEQVKDWLEDIIDKVIALDFTLDDGRSEGVTEDDVAAMIKKEFEDML